MISGMGEVFRAPADEQGSDGLRTKADREAPRSERQRKLPENLQQRRLEPLEKSTKLLGQDVLNSLRSTLLMHTGFFQIDFMLDKTVDNEAGRARVHLVVREIAATRSMTVAEVADQLDHAKQIIGTLPRRDGTEIDVTNMVLSPDNIRIEPEENVRKRREYFENRSEDPVPYEKQTTRIKQVSGINLVLVESKEKEGGRKMQAVLTMERAPLRARRLRILQAMLSNLTSIAENDPSLVNDPELHAKVKAVANALSIRGAQALQKMRRDIFSAREAAIKSEKAAFEPLAGDSDASAAKAEANKNSAAYIDKYQRFDGALAKIVDVASLDGEQSTNQTIVPEDALGLLSAQGFTTENVPDTASPLERSSAEETLRILRKQLKEYALWEIDATPIKRGANIFKTIGNNIGITKLGKKLKDSSLEAARTGRRFTPDVDVFESGGEVQITPSPETRESITQLENEFGAFKRELRGYASDAEGLRAALRLGFWDGEGEWPRKNTEEKTLIDALGKAYEGLPKLHAEIEAWKKEKGVEKLAGSSPQTADSIAYEVFERDIYSTLLDAEDVQGDVESLIKTINNDVRMEAIGVLANVSKELRAHIKESTDPEEVEMAGKVLFEIGHAVDDEQWSVVKGMAERLPKALGLAV